jgi:predicted ATPase
MKRGDPMAGLPRLRASVDQLRQASFVQYLTAFLGVLAEGLADAGDFVPASAAIDEAIARCAHSEERWYSPELLRIKGMVILKMGGEDAAVAAEDHFHKSLELARTQEALGWALRTAISLARLKRDQGRVGEAYDLLRPVHGRFSEGHGAGDLRLAKNLLDELSLGRR